MAASFTKKQDFLAVQNTQEQLLEILAEIAKDSKTNDNGAAIAEAAQALVSLYQKSVARLQPIFTRLRLSLPCEFPAAPPLDQPVSHGDRLLASVALCCILVRVRTAISLASQWFILRRKATQMHLRRF